MITPFRGTGRKGFSHSEPVTQYNTDTDEQDKACMIASSVVAAAASSTPPSSGAMPAASQIVHNTHVPRRAMRSRWERQIGWRTGDVRVQVETVRGDEGLRAQMDVGLEGMYI